MRLFHALHLNGILIVHDLVFYTFKIHSFCCPSCVPAFLSLSLSICIGVGVDINKQRILKPSTTLEVFVTPSK